MSLLPLKTAISDTYPLPSNATARAGFAALWDAINEFQQKSELDLASATTCDIGAQLSTKLRITGTTGITSLGTAYRGPIQLRFSGVVTITHNATSLRCPGGANYITSANSILMAWPVASVSGTLDGWQLVALDSGALIPAATVMAFFQASAPTGWTQVTTHNNKALRIVSGTGGGSGGSVAFTTAFANQAVTGSNSATTLTTAQIPAHTHNVTYGSGAGTGGVGSANGIPSGTSTSDGGTGGGASHNHTFTGTSINLAVQYIDMIIASKN